MKKAVLKTFGIFTGKRRCFPVNIAKILRTPILKNVCEQLLFYIQKQKQATVGVPRACI